MNLYEINQALMNCFDPETGEIYEEEFENLMLQKNEKIENIALWIKNLESDANQLRAEEKALAERRKAKESKAEQLRNYLASILNGQKFETSKCTVRFRKSERVEVDELFDVPEKFIHYSMPTVDKNAVKNAIKCGEEISGCRLIKVESMVIT